MPNQQCVLRPALGFCLLGFALSWYPWVLHLLGRPGNPGPNPLGLLAAAMVVVFARERMPGLREFLRQFARLRAGWREWALAAGAPALALGVAVGVALLVGMPMRLPNTQPLVALDRFLIMFLFVGLGEESAWRGFVQPLLQKALRPWQASLAVGAVWGLWHLPLMGAEFAWTHVPAFLVSVLAAAVVLAAIYNLSRSVLLPMICHAIVNTLVPPVMQTMAPEHLASFWWIYVMGWSGLAAAILIKTRGALGLPIGRVAG